VDVVADALCAETAVSKSLASDLVEMPVLSAKDCNQERGLFFSLSRYPTGVCGCLLPYPNKLNLSRRCLVRVQHCPSLVGSSLCRPSRTASTCFFILSVLIFLFFQVLWSRLNSGHIPSPPGALHGMTRSSTLRDMKQRIHIGRWRAQWLPRGCSLALHFSDTVPCWPPRRRWGAVLSTPARYAPSPPCPYHSCALSSTRPWL
jgi:hypothetical protein